MKTVVVPAHMRAKPGKVRKTVYVKRHKMKVPSKRSKRGMGGVMHGYGMHGYGMHGYGHHPMHHPMN